MAEKTEKATPKKLRDARKKGQVAKPQDFPSAVTFITAITLTLGLSHFLYDKLSGFLTSCFSITKHLDMKAQVGALFKEALNVIIVTSLPIAGAVAFVGVVTTFLIIGPVFSVQVFKPDIKKFNVVQNIKQKFKFKTLFELLKNLFKVGVAAFLIYRIMKVEIKNVIQTAGIPLEVTALIFNALLIKVVLQVGIFFIGVSILDLIYQKMTFAKEMKMEKFEVKQEYKDTEGNPEIKGRRRHLAQEIAYDEGPSATRRAKAVVTNPTHLAIAIGYEPEKYPAPYILAKGQGMIAEAIIKEAIRNNIPIMRNVPLARTLFESGKVLDYIPVETYEAIAEILRVVGAVEQENE
jgi:type III secretion protein U